MNLTFTLDGLRRNKGVVALCATIFFSMLGQGAVFPALPLFAKEFGVGIVLVGLAVGLGGTGKLLVGLPSGLLAQKYGRRHVLVGSIVLSTVGTAFMGFSGTFVQLILLRTMVGIGHGAFQVGASIYLRDVSTLQNRARYQSLRELSILLGVAMGPLIGGIMAEVWGLRAPFYFQACMTALAALISLFYIPETKHLSGVEQPASTSRSLNIQDDVKRTFLKVLLNPGLIVVGLFQLMVVTNRQGGRYSLMPLFGAEKGFGPGELGVFITITHLLQFFAVIVGGILADKFGRKFPIMPASIVTLMGILVFIYGDTYLLLAFSGLLLGIGEGLSGSPTAAFFADMAPRGLEGVTMGLFSSYAGTGALFGAMFLGALADFWSFNRALWVDGLLLVIAGLLVVVVARETANLGDARSRSSVKTEVQ